MANQKISEYLNTRNTFDDGDLFDVSAFLNPGYETQKTTYAIFKANLVSAGFLSSGDNVSELTNDAGYLTSIPASYLQSGDNVSELVNDAGYITNDTNFANTNLTFTASRTHTLGSNTLDLVGSGAVVSALTLENTNIGARTWFNASSDVGDIFVRAHGSNAPQDTIYQGTGMIATGSMPLQNVIASVTGTAWQVITDTTLLLSNPSVRMTMNSSGEFGFGTTPVASTRMAIGGDTYIDGNLRIDTPTPSVLGQVWTATDGFGNGSWQTPSGADGNGIYSSSDSIGADRIVTLSDGATTDRTLTFASITEANLLKLDSVNDRVGIGTSTPLAPFHVQGTILTTGAGNSAIADGNLLIGATSNTNNRRFLIDGVLTDYKAEIKTGLWNEFHSSGNLTGEPFLYNSISATDATLGGTALPCLNLARGILGYQSPRVLFNLKRFEVSGTSARTQLDLKLSHGSAPDTDVMTLRSNGNVGIGTTTPSAKLHVNGTGITFLNEGDARIDGLIGVDKDATAQIDILQNGGGFASAEKSGFIYGDSGNTICAGVSALGSTSFVHPKFFGRTDGTAGRAMLFEGQTTAANDITPTNDANAIFMFNAIRRETLTSTTALGTDNARLVSFNSANSGETRFEVMTKGYTRIWSDSSQSSFTAEGVNTQPLEVYGSGILNKKAIFSTFKATSGATTSNSLVVDIRGRYWDGAASQDISGTIQQVVDSTSPTARLVLSNNGNSGIEINELGQLIAPNLPTSSAGLPTGALWNNGGVINIV